MRVSCFFNQSPVFEIVIRHWRALYIALCFSLSLRHQSLPTMILLCFLPPSDAASALGVSDCHLFWWPTMALFKGLKMIWWSVLIRDALQRLNPGEITLRTADDLMIVVIRDAEAIFHAWWPYWKIQCHVIDVRHIQEGQHLVPPIKGMTW